MSWPGGVVHTHGPEETEAVGALLARVFFAEPTREAAAAGRSVLPSPSGRRWREAPDEGERSFAARALSTGHEVERSLQPGRHVTLSGDLGAGKTTLVRGLLRALGHAGAVKSPTFTLVESYELPPHEVHHFDLYRLPEGRPLAGIGFEDYLRPGALCLIEWPEREPRLFAPAAVRVHLCGRGETREIRLEPGAVLPVELRERLEGGLRDLALALSTRIP
jgi:tRNA threonylcarbamoyladenosine biosynthesis protein TsaE